MKKIVCALVVLALALPASAAVEITAVADGDSNAVIGYVSTGGDVVRCFGLDIQLDTDAKIVAVECLSDDYYVSPGNFTYDGVTPNFGSCVCDSGEPDTLGGIDTNGITIAMCSLYADDDPDHNVPPASSNGLVKITVDGECCITITENGRRGGVLDEDNVDIDPTLPNDPCLCLAGPPPPTCLSEDATEFSDWQTWGEPNCWCYQYQCRGDINGQKTMLWRVQALDLDMFRAAFFVQDGPLASVVTYGEPGICADLNHTKTMLWRVQALDLDEFRNYFFVTDPIPACDEAPVITGPYNFWLTP
jgi:hypothetical protein